MFPAYRLASARCSKALPLCVCVFALLVRIPKAVFCTAARPSVAFPCKGLVVSWEMGFDPLLMIAPKAKMHISDAKVRMILFRLFISLFLLFSYFSRGDFSVDLSVFFPL